MNIYTISKYGILTSCDNIYVASTVQYDKKIVMIMHYDYDYAYMNMI